MEISRAQTQGKECGRHEVCGDIAPFSPTQHIEDFVGSSLRAPSQSAKRNALSTLYLCQPGNRDTVHLLMTGMPVPATFGYPDTDGTVWSNYKAFVKQFHPLISICKAHPLSPFTRKERLVVFCCSVAFNFLWSAFTAYHTITMRKLIHRFGGRKHTTAIVVAILLIKHGATVVYAVLIRQLVICPCKYSALVEDLIDADDFNSAELLERAESLIEMKIFGDRILLILLIVHFGLIVSMLAWMASWNFNTERESRVRHTHSPARALRSILTSEALNFFLWFVKLTPWFLALYPIQRAMWYQGGTMADYFLCKRSCAGYRTSPNFENSKIGMYPKCVVAEYDRCKSARITTMMSDIINVKRAPGGKFHLSTLRRDSEIAHLTSRLTITPIQADRNSNYRSMIGHRFCNRADAISRIECL